MKESDVLVDQQVLSCINDLTNLGEDALDATLIHGCNPTVINHTHLAEYVEMNNKPFTKVLKGGFGKEDK